MPLEAREKPMSHVVVVRGHLVGDRTIELEEPVDRAAAVGELRVKLEPPTRRGPGLVELLDGLPPGRRLKEEIDTELEAERNNWG
jgi:hypothetical protein